MDDMTQDDVYDELVGEPALNNTHIKWLAFSFLLLPLLLPIAFILFIYTSVSDMIKKYR